MSGITMQVNAVLCKGRLGAYQCFEYGHSEVTLWLKDLRLSKITQLELGGG